MQDDWKETEIKNFLGISTRRTPQINECADCKDIEFRDTSGDMLSAVNPALFLSPPDFSSQGFTLAANLGFTTHVFSQLPISAPTTQEVIFYFQRGSVGGYPHIAIAMNPAWDGSSWFNLWRWLNKIVPVTISTASSYDYTVSSYDGTGIYLRSVVYNLTKQNWATITSFTPSGFKLTRNDWAVNDSLLIMANYLPLGALTAPFPYYTAQSSIGTADLAFHRILNELRIGFGSVANRLAVGIGYKKKYWQIDTIANGDTTLPFVADLDTIILDPYNIISDAGTFGIIVKFGGSSVAGSTSTNFPTGKYFKLIMTAILDDFNEYVVKDDFMVYNGSFPGVGPYKIYTGSTVFDIRPTIRFATMNKRVTKIRLWLALGNGIDSVLESPRLIKEFDIAKNTALNVTDKLWTLDNTGTLVLSDVATKTYSGWFNADYAAYVQGESLISALGYTPTTQYASSWDQALVAGGATYLLNPYIDKTWKNFIFNSPISGAGASQYDVISAENYQSLDAKDGNDIVGVELKSNLNFAILRSNGYQQYDADRQVPSQMINGVGIASTRLGIVNQNGAIFFPSQFDYYILQGNQSQDLSENTIRDVYRSLTKSNILGAKENYGSSVIFYAPTENKFYTFTPGKGWTTKNLGVITYFGSSSDGTLLYMVSTGSPAGSIYRVDPLQKVHTGTQDFFWISIPIDVALLGEKITSDDRFIVGSVWMKYASSKAITLQISYDGGVFGSDRTFPITQTALTSGTLTIGQKYIISSYVSDDDFVNVGAASNATGMEFTATGTTPTHWAHSSELTPATIQTVERRFTPGRNCKSFQLKITSTPVNKDVRTRICAIGIRWQVFKTGLFR